MCRRGLKRTDAAPRISVSVKLRGDQLTLDKRGLNSILHQEWPMAQTDGCLPAKLPVSVPSSADSSIVLLRAEDTQRAAAMGHLPSGRITAEERDSEGKYTHTYVSVLRCPSVPAAFSFIKDATLERTSGWSERIRTMKVTVVFRAMGRMAQ